MRKIRNWIYDKNHQRKCNHQFTSKEYSVKLGFHRQCQICGKKLKIK